MAVAILERDGPEVERFGSLQSKTPTMHPKTAPPLDPAGESMVTAMGPERTERTQPLSPELMLLLRAVDGMTKVAEPLATMAKQPGGKGPYVVALVASMVFSMVFSIAAVWVHDQSTSGKIGGQLEDHDKAISSAVVGLSEQRLMIAALADVVGGLIDEGESDMDWMEEALGHGFAGRPIPKRSTAGRNRLRRMLPNQ